jgi:hypothetical protein
VLRCPRLIEAVHFVALGVASIGAGGISVYDAEVVSMPDPQIIGQYVDRIHRDALRRLGHPPRDDLTFRHDVAVKALRRLRERDWYGPGPE